MIISLTSTLSITCYENYRTRNRLFLHRYVIFLCIRCAQPSISTPHPQFLPSLPPLSPAGPALGGAEAEHAWQRCLGGVLAAFWRPFLGVAESRRKERSGAERSGRARAKGAALRGGGALARRGRRKFRDTWAGVEQWRGELALQTARERRRAHLCRPAARPPALRPSPWRPPRSSAARLSLGT